MERRRRRRRRAGVQVHLPLVAGVVCAHSLDSFDAQGEQRELTPEVFQNLVHLYLSAQVHP